MRVFMGIELNEIVKQQLFEIEQQLEKHCSRGNFTTLNNFHLTLQFIGHATADDIDQFKQVLHDTAAESTPFEITINGLGEFPKKKRSVVWAGPERDSELSSLYDELHEQFNRHQWTLQKKPFVPHITLGRNLLLTETFAELEQQLQWEPISIKIDQLTLFESVRINDQLIYRPIQQFKMDESTI